MRYAIVETATPRELVKTVNTKLAEGWAPLGGVSLSAVDMAGAVDEVWYAQAMVNHQLDPLEVRQCKSS